METFTITIDADDLPDPRPLDLVDLEAELACRPGVLAAVLTGSVETGGIRGTMTVEADDEEKAAHLASGLFARALVATGRTMSVARVEAVAPGDTSTRAAPVRSGPVELDGGPLDGWRVTTEEGLRRITFHEAPPSEVEADYRSVRRTTDDGVPVLRSRSPGAAPDPRQGSEEAMRALVQIARELPDLDAAEAMRRVGALGPAHREVGAELVTRMELLARRYRLESAGATIQFDSGAAGASGARGSRSLHRCAVTLSDGRSFESRAERESDAQGGAYAEAEAALDIT